MILSKDAYRRVFQLLRSQASRFSWLHRIFWKVNRLFVSSPVLSEAWKAALERKRLTLPAIPLGSLGLEGSEVLVPGIADSSFDEDAYLEDMLFLVQLSKKMQSNRLLEVGTYRAKTAYALHLNRPQAFVCSYDIRVVDSVYRQRLQGKDNVSLRLGSFTASGAELRAEEPYDFIFIDGSHRLEDVLTDSELAFSILAKTGVIIWHDYRRSGFVSPDLQVPEALHILAARFPIQAVKDTNCAIYRVIDGVPVSAGG